MDKLSKLILNCVLFSLLFLSLTLSVRQSSPLRQFNVTPDELYLNWTNDYASNITITVNESFTNITVRVYNETNVTGNYSQNNVGKDDCQLGSFHLLVRNSAGEYNNTIGPITNETQNSTNVTILMDTKHLACDPGKYWIKEFTIKNATQDDENANITVFVDIPISIENNPSLSSNGIGSFNGKLSENAKKYHSFYFNTSLIPNVTGVKINLSLSRDVDLFLLDESKTLKAKSINTTTTESLLYNYFPQNKWWEIRVYGNSTDEVNYNGSIIFTTLNITNTSDAAQQISSIDFGDANASESKQTNITLRNEGNLTLLNVTQSIELYMIRRFGGNGAKNFTVLIPNSSIALKVKASLNWTGSSNYSLKIYNQNDILLASSANKHLNANVSEVMQEEYNETSNIGNTAGLWKFEVSNTSVSGDPYNLTVFVYVNSTNWIKTNYSTMTFNTTDNENYTTDVEINLTVQSDSFDGDYEGSIQYLDSRGAGIKIPIFIKVRTPMLIVNNTLVSLASRIDENYGVNLTRTINFILNNTGYYDLNITITNSSGVLTCVSGCGTHFANFTFNSITSIGNYSSEILSVNITYNSSADIGIYEGWIFINASNSPVSLSSHPYETFNITLRLNLTRDLDVRAFDLISVDGDKIIGNVSNDENVTIKLKIYYVNGTTIEAGNALNTSNFKVWLTHKNKTYTIPDPISNGLNLFNGTDQIYNDTSKTYSINFTVPKNKPGGWYDVHVTVNYTKNPSYNGSSTNQSLLINSSAVYLERISDQTITMYEGEYEYYNITAINYGPLIANGSITFSNSSCAYADIVADNTNCTGASKTGNTWSYINLSANGTKVCYFSWKITAFNVTEYQYCENLQITYSEPNLANITGIKINVDNYPNATTTTTISSEQGEEETTTTTTIPQVTLKYLNISYYPSLVSVEQGSNKTERVTVSNINNTLLQHVNLTILDIDSKWFSVNPSTRVRIENNTSYNFSVTFNIPENATVKDYAGKFYAESFYGSDTKTFTLRVTPGKRMQSEILANLSSYQSQVLELEKQLNESKKKGWNNTEAENLLRQLKEKLNQAFNYVNSSDYWSAYDLFDEIESLINQTKVAMLRSEIIKGFWEWGKWVVIAIVIVVAIVLIYLFWPVSGFKPEKEYAPEKKEEKIMLKEKLEKLKEKWRKAQEKR